MSANDLKTQGNALFQSGDFTQALKLFSEAITLSPDDHVLYSNRSACHAKLENYPSALNDAEKCVSLKPDWARGYQRLGLAQFYLKKYKEAVATYEKGIQIDPNNVSLKEGLEQAQQALEEGGYIQQMLLKLMADPETKEYLQDPTFVQKMQMIQQNPQMIGMFANDPKVQKALQVMFGLPQGFKFPDSQEAKPHDHSQCSEEHSHAHQEPFSEAPHSSSANPPPPPASTSPSSPPSSSADSLRLAGNEEYKKRNFEKALELYDQALAVGVSPAIINNKTACFIEMGDFKKAMETIDEALGLYEEQNLKDFVLKAKLYARKASIFQKLDQLNESIAFYEKSLLENVDPKVKDELRKVEKLLKEQEALKYIDPVKAEEHNNKGKELFTGGKFPEALKEYDEAIKRNPSEAKLYSNKSACLVKLMDFAGALTAIDKCLELDPNFMKAYGRKGSIHFLLKEYHKSIGAYEKGLKLDPENVECKEGVVKVRSAMYSNESQETQEERARHAMADPEIQAILKNPNIMNILRNLQENPNNPENLKALRDPDISKSINKLVESGILKMG